MTKKNAIDGFVPRRPGNRLGGLEAAKGEKPSAATGLGEAKVTSDRFQPARMQETNLGKVNDDLSESLKNIDTTLDEPGKKGRKGRKKRGPISKKRRIIKWSIIAIIVIILGIGGWILYRGMMATGNIFQGNIFDIIQNKPLKQDANGRSNILVVGTSLDDPGHDAPYLTDSIMVVSIDQKNKNAYMVSLPRDLEVEYGQACLPGYSGKINSYYHCVGGANGNVDADRKALKKTGDFIGDIIGLDIHYGVNVNYTVMRELVKALDGITVTIESRDPRGQMDSNFDWKCGVGDPKVSYSEVLKRCPPSGHYIDYPNGPVKLDAEHALYLAQARGDRAPTYGFEQSNFDREKNQQKIVKAIREKAMSTGVLADPGKVTGVIDALGNNLRTTFEAAEVRTLISLAQDIKDKDIQSISLVDGDNPVMNGNAQPSAGLYQYDAIRALIKKKLSSNPVVREEAKVVVMNGSGTVGVAQTEADKLTAQGFTISSVENAPNTNYKDITIYQIGSGKTATKEKLESIYGVTVLTTKAPAVAAGTNFVIIIGKDSSAKSD
jgi:anionic cell wall polymer biosynthesis LytR-Cps2A-Psr (LCP) family protein